MSLDKGTCRSCGASILWGTMRKSLRKVPLDAELTVIEPGKPERTLYRGDDKGFVDGFRGREGHRIHHETCPQGQAWKKPRPKAGEQMEFGS